MFRPCRTPITSWAAILAGTVASLTQDARSAVVLGAGFFLLSAGLAAGAAELYRSRVST